MDGEIEVDKRIKPLPDGSSFTQAVEPETDDSDEIVMGSSENDQSIDE